MLSLFEWLFSILIRIRSKLNSILVDFQMADIECLQYFSGKCHTMVNSTQVLLGEKAVLGFSFAHSPDLSLIETQWTFLPSLTYTQMNGKSSIGITLKTNFHSSRVSSVASNGAFGCISVLKNLIFSFWKSDLPAYRPNKFCCFCYTSFSFAKMGLI